MGEGDFVAVGIVVGQAFDGLTAAGATETAAETAAVAEGAIVGAAVSDGSVSVADGRRVQATGRIRTGIRSMINNMSLKRKRNLLRPVKIT